MSDFKAWQDQAKPFKATVDVCADGELVAELDAAWARLEKEKEGQLEPPSELEAHVAALSKKVEEKTRTFVFQSIGRREWRKLSSEHPPTDEQKALEPELDHNPDTFPPAALAASCSEPRLTDEDAQWLCDVLPDGEFFRIWSAVLSANLIGGDAKKAVATAAAVLSEKK